MLETLFMSAVIPDEINISGRVNRQSAGNPLKFCEAKPKRKVLRDYTRDPANIYKLWRVMI